MIHLVLVEADDEVRSKLERELTEHHFEVSSTPDGDEGMHLVEERDADLLLLDMNLPVGKGLETLRKVRASRPRIPIFAMSSLDDTGTIVVGLDAGADEYVTKPVSVRKLAARVKARLRHSDEEALSSGALTLDLAAHSIVLDGRNVDVSARELGMLATFMRHEGEVLSRRELLEAVWNIDFDPGSNVVQVYVRSLRKKLGADAIETVRGRGYRFVAPRGASQDDVSGR
ncbi:MAG: response regulator transcription factor [Actinomycetota bacterium]